MSLRGEVRSFMVDRKKPRSSSSLPVRVWYAAMALAGLVFGLIGERRPFGDGIFAHPLVVLFILVGAALLALRVVLARPVPEVISERALAIGCVAALAAFLAGNFASAHLIGLAR
jgi:hypothetical protein